jgi:hypothetical protein
LRLAQHRLYVGRRLLPWTLLLHTGQLLHWRMQDEPATTTVATASPTTESVQAEERPVYLR